jgi:hypothetical protein
MSVVLLSDEDWMILVISAMLIGLTVALILANWPDPRLDDRLLVRLGSPRP